jgi:eukaryotic-like serine/threonine-protein kinase
VNGPGKPPNAAADVGRLVDGRFRLGEVIGVGGMATVHRAHDLRLDRMVAIKLLRREVLDDPDLAMRFRREALAATVLRHPNIVACLEAGTDDGQPFLVMELIDGDDLASWLRERGRMSSDGTVRIGLDVARALGVAHVRGIVHRDVKPGNIILARDGRAMVTDFGIARLAADAEGSIPGTTLGSVHYFSPEQALGRTTTAASDVYGLGLVLYEALVGRRAWHGGTSAEIASARVGRPAPSPREARPDVPAALDAIVARALQPDPMLRYANGADMASALEGFAARAARGDGIPADASTTSVAPLVPAATAPLVRSGATVPAGSAAPRARRAPAPIAGPLVVLAIVAVVVSGALLIAALPAPGGLTAAARESPAPTKRVAAPTGPASTVPATSSPSTTPAPGTPTPVPLRTPRPPTGRLADLCEPFFGFACGVGPGRVEPTAFQPTVRFTLEEGWSVAELDRRLLTLVRDEGWLTLASALDGTFPAGSERAAPQSAHLLVESFIGTDRVAAAQPRTRQVGKAPAVVVDLTPLDREWVPLFRIGPRVFSLEPGSPTRIMAVDAPTGLVVIAIGADRESSLQAILPAAKAVIDTLRFR